MGRYWSLEECRWVEHVSTPENDTAVEAPEQRVPEDEPVPTS